ncbi:hypothetical protein ACFL5Y_02900, partial [Candidatus Omnitrophota bacterium]
HTVALKTDGGIYAWGSNSYGQLGNNSITDSLIPVVVVGVDGVGELTGISQIAAGGNHTVALTNGAEVYAWGYNGMGQLGDGTTDDSPTPVLVSGLTGVSQIAAGSTHTVARKDDGSVYTWGGNEYGQLGNGDSSMDSSVPVAVLGVDGVGELTGISQIAAGGYHTVALKSDETEVYTWGDNTYGQLGDPSVVAQLPSTVAHSPTPVKVVGVGGAGLLSGISQIAAGGYHTVALKSDETEIYAWGYNEYGQLGDGTTDNSSVPVIVTRASGLGSLTGISQIAAGGNHTVALKTGGIGVYAWGDNSQSQLGADSSAITQSSTPLVVMKADGATDPLTGISQIAAGASNTAALKVGGSRVYTWGNNDSGQLGDNSTTQSAVPVEVLSRVGSTGSLTDISQIVAGHAHTVALKSDGTRVYAWGWNNVGQLGVGEGTIAYSLRPVVVLGVGGEGPLTGISQIAAGFYHTLALKADGTEVYAWGSNSVGQLGDDNVSGSQSPIPVVVSGVGGIDYLTDISQIAAGVSHSVALKSDGTEVYAWGSNSDGQLGDPSIVDQSPTPVVVLRGQGSGSGDYLTDISQIAAGYLHTVALKSDGTEVYTWGDNAYGQLGNGDEDYNYSPTPVKVVGVGGTDLLTYISQIAAGAYHTVALKSDETEVYAWGDNRVGQLGDPSVAIKTPTPVVVVGVADPVLTGISQIAAGAGHTVALKTDGSVCAWGSNEDGQLGDNSTTYSSRPVVVSGVGGSGSLTGISQIAAGGFHTVALKKDATGAYAWGDNSSGQLGAGSTTSQFSVPVEVKVLVHEAPFVVEGTFTPEFSHFKYSGDQGLGIPGHVSQALLENTTYYKLEIDINDLAETYILAGEVTALGDITITAGTLDVSTNSYWIYCGGNWTNNATFISREGKVTFDGTVPQTIITGGIGAGNKFYDVVISDGADVALAQNHIDIDGALTIGTDAALNIDVYDMNIAGNFTNSGEFSTLSTVTFDGQTQLTSNSARFNDIFVGTSDVTGSVTLVDNLDIDGDLIITLNGNLNAVARDMYSAGHFMNYGTFTIDAPGTVYFDGTTDLRSNAARFNDVVIGTDTSNGSVTLLDHLDINGDFTIYGGTLNVSGYNMNLAGNWVNSGTFTSSTGTVIFDGTAPQTITTGGTSINQDFDNLTIANTSGDVTLTQDAEIDGMLTIDAGATFDNAGYELVVNALDNSGTLLIQGGETVTITNMDTDSGTVVYNGPSLSRSGLFDTTGDYHKFYNLILNDALNAQATWTLEEDLDVNGTLTIVESATLDIKGNNLSVGVAFDNFGLLRLEGGQSYNPLPMNVDSGTVEYYGDGLDGGYSNLAAGYDYYNLIINGEQRTWTLDNDLTVANDLSITSGTLSGEYNVTVTGGDVTGDGTINLTGGKFILDGNGSLGGNTNWTFYDLTFGDETDAETTTKIGEGEITVKGGLRILREHTLRAGSTAWNLELVTGNPFIVYEPVGEEPAGIFDPQTSLFRYRIGSSGDLTPLAGGSITYYDLEIDNPGQTYVLAGDVTALNHISIIAGTLDVTENNYAINCGGDWTNDDTFLARLGLVTFNGTAGQAIGGIGTSRDFYDLTISNTSDNVTMYAEVNVANHLLVGTNATLDASGYNLSADTFNNLGTLRLKGGEAAINITMDTDTGTVEYYGAGITALFGIHNSYNNLTFSGGNLWELPVGLPALSVGGTLTIAADTTLDINGNNLYVNTPDTGTLDMADSGILRIQGAEEVIITNMDTNSGTVIFDGDGTYTLGTITTGGTTVPGAYNNLAFNSLAGTGNWTLVGGGLTVEGDLTVTAGDVITDHIVYIGGDLLVEAGASFTTSNTVFNGEAAQLITMSGSSLVCDLIRILNTGTDSVTFDDEVVANTLTAFEGAYSVAFNDGVTATTDTTFLNTGGVTLGNNTTDISTFTGGLDTTAGNTTVAGIVKTTDSQIDLGATTMTADTELISGSEAINVASITGNYMLKLQEAGGTAAGAVTFTGNVTVNGLTTYERDYAVTLQGAANVIDLDTSFLNTGLTTIGNEAADSSTFTGGLDAVSAGGVRVAGTVVTADNNMDLGATTMTEDTTLKSGSGAINVESITGSYILTLQDDVGAAGGVTFNDNVTVGGLTTYAQAYAVTLKGAINVIDTNTNFLNTNRTTIGTNAADSNTFTGGLGAVSVGGVYIAGTVVTGSTNMDLGATTMTGDTILDSGAGAINVVSVTDGDESYTLTLQDGDVTFSGGVTIGELVTFGLNYSVALNGGGTITNDVTFLNTGGVTLGNDALDSITFTGGLDTTVGDTTAAGTVITTDNQMELGVTTMTADTALKSGSGAINVESITDGGNGYALKLQDNDEPSGAKGAVTFSGNVTVGELETYAQDYAVTLQGDNVIGADTNFLNTGGVTFDGTIVDVDGFVLIDSGVTVYANLSEWTVAGSWTNNGIFDAGSSAVTFDGPSPGSIHSGDSAFYHMTLDLVNTGDTFELADPLEVDGNLTITTGKLDAKTSNIDVAGNWTNSDTFVAGSSTVTFDATTGTRSITSGSSRFNNIIFNDGGETAVFLLEDALVVDGNLTITGGTLDANVAENNSISVAGDWTNNDIFLSRTGEVAFDGVAPQSIYTGGDVADKAFHNVVIENASGVTVINNPMKVNNTLTINAGASFDINGNDLTFSTLNNSGTLILQGIEVLPAPNNMSGSTVVYQGTPAPDDDIDMKDWTGYYKLTIDADSTDTFNGVTDISVGGDLTITNGNFDFGSEPSIDLNISGNLAITNGSINLNAPNGANISLAGDLTISGAGTVTHAAGNWIFNGTEISTISTVVDNIPNLGDVTISQQIGGNKTVQLAGEIIVERLSIGTDDILSLEGNALTVNADFDNNGTLRVWGTEQLIITNPDTGSGTVEYVGSDLTTDDIPLNYGNEYWNLTINSTTGDDIFSSGGDVTVNGAMVISQGTFYTNGHDLDVTGTFTNYATLKVQGGEAKDFLKGPTNGEGSTSTVIYAGEDSSTSDTMDVEPWAYHHLTIAGEGEDTFRVSSGDISVAGDLTITSDTLDTKNGSGEDKNVNVVGHINIEEDGTLIANASNIQLQGDWHNENGGTFDAGSSTVVFACLTGSRTMLTPGVDDFFNVTIETDPAYEVILSSLTGDLDLNGTLTINTGTLDAKGGDISIGGNFYKSAGGFLIDPGKVTFDGGAASITSSGFTFGNVEINSPGTVTLLDPLTIGGNLTITGGILDAGAQPVEITGNFTNNASSAGFSSSGLGEVTFNGTAVETNQIIGGTFLTQFQNLTISNIATDSNVALGNAVDIVGTLTINQNAVFVANGQDLTVDTLDNSGTLVFQGGEIASIANMDTDTGTVVYNDLADSLSGLIDTGSHQYNNLILNGAKTWTFDDALTVNGRLTTAAVATLDIDGKTLTVGELVNNGTLVLRGDETVIVNASLTNEDDSTVRYTGLSTDPADDINVKPWIYDNLIIAGEAGDTFRVPLGADLSVDGAFTITSGTFDTKDAAAGTDRDVTVGDNVIIETEGILIANNSIIEVAGDWDNDNGGTFTAGGSEVVFNGSGDQTIYTPGTDDFYGLTVEALESYNTVTFASASTLTGYLDLVDTLTINSGTFDAVGKDMHIGGGFFKTADGILADDPGKVTFGGDAALITSNGAVFGDVEIALANLGGEVTLADTLTIDGNLTITKGELALDVNTPDVYLAGNLWIHATDGAVIAGTGIWTFNGTGTSTVTGDNPDLGIVSIDGDAGKTVQLASEIIATTLTIGSDNILSLEGNAVTITLLQNDGTLRVQGDEDLTGITNKDINSGTVEYVGDGSAALSYSLKYGNEYFGLTINSSQGDDIFLPGGDVTVDGDMEIIQGTFFTDGNDLDVSGTFINEATLKLHGVEDIPKGPTNGDGATSTVIYVGEPDPNNPDNINIQPWAYHNLTIDGANPDVFRVPLGADLSIEGNFTIISSTFDTKDVADTGENKNVTVGGNVKMESAGTLMANDSTIQVAGDWDNDGDGIFAYASSTVIFNGSADQKIYTHGVDDFFNVTIETAEPGFSVTPETPTDDLRLSGTLIINRGTFGFSTGEHAVDIGGSDGGDLVINNGGSFISSGLLVVDGDITINDSGTLNADNNDITIQGSFFSNHAGGFMNPGKVHFDGDEVSITSNGTHFGDVEIDSGDTVTLEDPLNIDGNLTIIGSTLDAGAQPVAITGNFINDASFTSTSTVSIGGDFTNNAVFSTSGTVVFNGTLGDQRIIDESGTPPQFQDLRISNASPYEVILDTGIDIAGELNITNGAIFDLNGKRLTADVLDNNSGGTLVIKGDEEVTINDMELNLGTVIYEGLAVSASGLIITNTDPYYYTHLILEPAGAETWMLDKALTVNGKLTIIDGAKLDINGNDITVAQLENTGTLALQGGENEVYIGSGRSTSGTVEYYGTGQYDGLVAGDSYYDLKLNSEGSGTWTLNNTLYVNGELNINAGTLNDNGNYIYLAGDFFKSTSGAFNASGRVVFNGTTDLTSNNAIFNDVDIQGSVTLTGDSGAGDLYVNGNVLSIAGNLNDGEKNIYVTGNDVDFYCHDSDSLTATGKVIFSGTTNLESYDARFNDVEITSGGSVTLYNHIKIGGDLTIRLGGSGGGALDASWGYDIEIAGDWSNSGLFWHGSNTVIFNGTGLQQIDTGGTDGSKAFYNLDIAKDSSVMLTGTDAIYITEKLT